MTRLIFEDRCTATSERKPPAAVSDTIAYAIEVRGDSIVCMDEVVAVRVEPVGFGDVHWERPDGTRFTHVRIEATTAHEGARVLIASIQERTWADGCRTSPETTPEQHAEYDRINAKYREWLASDEWLAQGCRDYPGAVVDVSAMTARVPHRPPHEE